MSFSVSNEKNAAPDPVRPRAVGVVAVIGLICSVFWLPLPPAWHRGIGYGFHMLVSSALGMVCMYGFWRMWRWSVFVYALLTLLDMLHYWILLRARVYAPAVEAVIAFVGLLYLRRMR